MMGYGYWGDMMGASGVGVLWLLTWLIVTVDLVLAGIWLYQQVAKNH